MTSNTSSSSSVDDSQLTGLRQALKSLDVQRDSLELEADAIVSELNAVNPSNPSAPPMGVDTPLVDSEGYPRNDIDVYRARTLRGRLAMIRTDHKKLMQDIEGKLKLIAILQDKSKLDLEKVELEARTKPKPKPKYDPITGKWVVRNWDGTIAGAGKNSNGRSFDNLSSSSDSSNNNANNNARPENAGPSGDSSMQNSVPDVKVYRADMDSTNPYARVESVAPNSPASTAGLQGNDLILAFGPITGDGMLDIPELVKTAAANNEKIELRIKRNDNDKVLLILQPRPWNGRGLLGFRITNIGI